MTQKSYTKKIITIVFLGFLSLSTQAFSSTHTPLPSPSPCDILLAPWTKTFEEGLDQWEQIAKMSDDVADINKPFIMHHQALTDRSVLLIHGFTDSPHTMREVAQLYFQNGFNVVSIRLAGHGTRYQDLATVSYTDWLADTTQGLSVATALGRKISVVGFSTGGGLAINAVMRYHALINDFLLVAPLVGLPTQTRILAKNKAWLKYVFPYVPKKIGNTNYMYGKISINALAEVVKLADLNLSLLKEFGRLPQPASVITTENDKTVNNKNTKALIEANLEASSRTYEIPASQGVLHREILLKQNKAGKLNPELEKVLGQIQLHIDRTAEVNPL